MSLVIPETNTLGLSNYEVAEALVRFATAPNIFGGDAGLNGHCWSERPDGTIDDEDHYADECRSVMKIKNRKINYYECSNPLTIKIIIKKIEQAVSVLTGDFKTSLQLLDECWVQPMENSCMFNALIKSKRNGGTVKFGSIGIDSDDGSITFWLSGNKKFSTFNDFIAPENMCDRFTINHPDKAVSMATKLFKTLSNY